MVTRVKGSVWRLGDNHGLVSPKDEGAKGDGVTDDTAAIQAILDAGRSISGDPDDVFLISAPLNLNTNFMSAIGNDCTLRNATDGRFFKVEGLTTAISDIDIQGWRLQSTAAAADDYALDFVNCNRVVVSDLFCQDINSLAVFGRQASGEAKIITLRDVNGWSHYASARGLDFRACTDIRARGVNLSIEGVTALGAAALRLNRESSASLSIDTIMIDQCQFQLFFRGIDAINFEAGGNAQNIWITDTVFDGNVEDGALLNPASTGEIHRIFCNNVWMTANNGRGWLISGNGVVRDVTIQNSLTLQCAYEGASLGANGTFIRLLNSRFQSANQLNTGVNGVTVAGEDCTVRGCEVGYSHTTAATTKPIYAMSVAADVLRYRLEDNKLDGSTGGLSVGANAAGSKLRTARGNEGAVESVTVTVPSSTVAWTNLFPYTLEIHTIGGTVSAIAKNGTGIGTGSPVILKPGETVAWTYSAAPTAAGFVL